MLWTFLIDHWKVNFLGYIWPKSRLFFRVTTVWLIKNHPFGPKITILNQSVDTKMLKAGFFFTKQILNQLIECRKEKLKCINYYYKCWFHTVQANIHRFSDSNDRFGPIEMLSDRTMGLSFYSFCRLIVNCDKTVTTL